VQAEDCRQSLEQILVPSKGLEPPHRCRYMDLNHARLPIPPRWQMDCSCSDSLSAAGQEEWHFHFTEASPAVKLNSTRTTTVFCGSFSCAGFGCGYASFAFIEIFAFNTFEIGQPFSAASAYFWNVGASAPGTFPTTSM